MKRKVPYLYRLLRVVIHPGECELNKWELCPCLPDEPATTAWQNAFAKPRPNNPKVCFLVQQGIMRILNRKTRSGSELAFVGAAFHERLRGEGLIAREKIDVIVWVIETFEPQETVNKVPAYDGSIYFNNRTASIRFHVSITVTMPPASRRSVPTPSDASSCIFAVVHFNSHATDTYLLLVEM